MKLRYIQFRRGSMQDQRRKVIQEMLEESEKITLDELGTAFPDVSHMTLRRDLIHLEEQGFAIRVKGGAIKAGGTQTQPGEESAYLIREHKQKGAKYAIAKKALPYLETGRSVYLDAGSTVMAFAQLLEDDYYSFITSGINIAQKLLEKEQASVIVLGGFANRNTLSLSGPLSSIILDTLNIDIAFISASGFTRDNHFTVSNIYEAELKTKIISKARKVVVMMDSSKVGKSLPYTFARLDNVDVFITETDLDEDMAEFIRSTNTELK